MFLLDQFFEAIAAFEAIQQIVALVVAVLGETIAVLRVLVAMRATGRWIG